MIFRSMLLVILATSIVCSQTVKEISTRDVKSVDAHTPKEVQMQLAESAGPPSVGQNATIYVLGAKGYELARKGTNGFTCLIDRQFTNTIEPECFDAEGTATTLKARFFMEEQRAKGVSETEISQQVHMGYKHGRFQPPRRPGIVYMLSDNNYVFDPESKTVIHFPGHVMFYAPFLTESDIGKGKGAPYLTHPGEPDSLMVVVPASKKSE